MHQFLVMVVWGLLAACVVLIGRMVDNESILGVGAWMLLFTCAFAC